MYSSRDRPKLLSLKNLFGYGVSFLKLIFKKSRLAHPQQSSAPTPAEPPQIDGLEWNLVCEIAQFWITKYKDNPDLVFLIQERMGNLSLNWAHRSENVHLQSFVLAAADFYDELGWLPIALNSGDLEQDLSLFQAAITRALYSVGAELIRNTAWDPSVQRAAAIERTQQILNSPKILRFGRSGITLCGKILRKQEVILLSN